MRALDRGESFVVARNGVPVGELTPTRRRCFVPAQEAVAAFRDPGTGSRGRRGVRMNERTGLDAFSEVEIHNWEFGGRR